VPPGSQGPGCSAHVGVVSAPARHPERAGGTDGDGVGCASLPIVASHSKCGPMAGAGSGRASGPRPSQGFASVLAGADRPILHWTVVPAVAAPATLGSPSFRSVLIDVQARRGTAHLQRQGHLESG
jgi:hypothetical protein